MAERPQHPFLGSVFSGPKIKHKLMAQVHHFPLTQLELPEEQSFESQAKGKQKPTPADGAVHPGRVPQAMQTGKLILAELHDGCNTANEQGRREVAISTLPNILQNKSCF